MDSCCNVSVWSQIWTSHSSGIFGSGSFSWGPALQLINETQILWGKKWLWIVSLHAHHHLHNHVLTRQGSMVLHYQRGSTLLGRQHGLMDIALDWKRGELGSIWPPSCCEIGVMSLLLSMPRVPPTLCLFRDKPFSVVTVSHYICVQHLAQWDHQVLLEC